LILKLGKLSSCSLATAGRSFQQLTDEAFADLLAKHHRPRTVKDALKESARLVPANENKPRKRRR
jgi:hypothetical protein